MKPIVTGSVVLAVAVTLCSAAIIATGLNQNLIVGQLGAIVLFILLNVGTLLWTLKQTAPESGYGKQLANGALFGLISGVLIFLMSWVLLAVVFPNAVPEQAEATIAYLQQSGLPQQQIDGQIEALRQATPLSQALPGLIGTFFTSLVAAAIIAIFVRRK